MKTFRLSIAVAMLSLFAITSCQKSALIEFARQENSSTVATDLSGNNAREEAVASATAETCNPDAYIITLESRAFVNGSWEWVWSVQNSNPGNGNGGTVQDLSHWGMQFSPCNVMSSVIGAAYSADGINWLSFTPAYQVDLSQNCASTTVFKFDYGTIGSNKSYYKLVLSEDYPVASSFGYYKSGNRTGCCTFNLPGIGCSGFPPDIK